MQALHALSTWISEVVYSMGYIGIFIGMALESTVIPLPSEIIMIPAGYLVFQGKMNMLLAISAGAFGSTLGSYLNYIAAKKLGRGFLLMYGKYFFVSRKNVRKMDKFFKKHGDLSIFIGRLLFGVRHFISIPAGLSKMPLSRFLFFTLTGSAIWSAVLVAVGFVYGNVSDSAHFGIIIKICVFVACAGFVVFYLLRRRRKISRGIV